MPSILPRLAAPVKGSWGLDEVRMTNVLRTAMVLVATPRCTLCTLPAPCFVMPTTAHPPSSTPMPVS